MKKYLAGWLAGICLLLSAPYLSAQNDLPRQFLYLDDWTYDLIDYRVNSGELSPAFVLNQPYRLDEIRSGAGDDRWGQLVGRYVDHFYGGAREARLVLYGRDNLSLVSKSNLPGRNPVLAAPVDDVFLFDNNSGNHYNFAAFLHLKLPHFSLVNRTVINSELLDDPLYFGDSSSWLYGRNNDAYLNVNFSGFDFFLGRMDRNWGTLRSPGLILSNAPYSYDHLQLSYTASKLKFSMLISRLEDMPGQDFESDYPDSLFEARKFLSAHRLDIALSPRLQFALTEVAIYGGPGRDFEFGYLNPAALFYLVQRNNLQQISGLWAVDLFYKPHAKVNFNVQFLLDDFIVNNVPDQDDRAAHPDRMGISMKISQADLWLPGLQTGLNYTRIGNRTYQSFRTWENFNYHGKGLGYPAASIERLGLDAAWFNAYPAIFKFTASFQRSGEARLTDMFNGEKDDKFPVGTVERVWQFGLKTRYVFNHWSQFTTEAGYESYTNMNHVPGQDVGFFKFILGLNATFGVHTNIH